jgi:DNA damage-binding protein 1
MSEEEKRPLSVHSSDIEMDLSDTRAKNARKAFYMGDQALSKAVHDHKRSTAQHEEEHTEGGDLLKPMVFGGLDGIITSFAVVAAAAGGGYGISIVLVMGFSNILADGLSMGIGEYLSSKAEADFTASERKREEWEVANYLEGEIEEMVDIFTQRGMTQEDAATVINIISKYDQFFVDLMMTEELGLQREIPTHSEMALEGLIMFGAFFVFGSMPVLGYCIFPPIFPDMSDSDLFLVACIITGCAMFALGAFKGTMAGRPWYVGGTEILLLGGTCAVAAYLSGALVDSLVA